jgi:hypothetical protein
MEVTIKKIGYKTGTVGWLAAGLADHSVRIAEGRTKRGAHHGLWLHWGEQQQEMLACHNQYGLTLAEYAEADAYKRVDEQGGREAIFTDACWATLMQIADEWCAACNAERQADVSIPIKIIRTEICA